MPGLSCGMQTLSCGVWDLVSWPGVEPRPPTLGAQSLSHWSPREVPRFFIVYFFMLWIFLTIIYSHQHYTGLIFLHNIFQFSSVQLLNCVRFFVTPWTAVYQASLSITNSQSSLKLMSIESVMSSNHLILIVIPFFSRLQSFPASGYFPMSQFFASGGQVLEFQLQYQSFKWTLRTDFL